VGGGWVCDKARVSKLARLTCKWKEIQVP
jgi:hypothetical protein